MNCFQQVRILSVLVFLIFNLFIANKSDAEPFLLSGVNVLFDAQNLPSGIAPVLDVNELQGLKIVEVHERNEPKEGKKEKWRGVKLVDLIDMALKRLPNESQAQVDLMVIKSRTGQTTFLPRAFLNKYPVLLGTRSGNAKAGLSGLEWSLVLPWSTHPKMLKEDLPIMSYKVADVVQIELSSYRNRFHSLFLKRRTDPSAIRGEKYFVKNCTGCHNRSDRQPAQQMVFGAPMERIPQFVNSGGHQNRNLDVFLTPRDRKSLMRYVEAYAAENPTAHAAKQ